ncbi:DUF3558 domain-containing protein [Streptomyces sp. NBC_01142]|uniref:DUF3558 domain-containing protein n=1 Tax=Streptomyces sp. NBC_01142 TaxID=2975865 RepID=UPI002258B511|nr:DUF3558 domain-containing protein [Streptomyces sp. NBC_01142]MCX4818544.1 DUF3558 domain-containing protein [Streptomyces sp. NBC_01142]
MQRKAYVPGLAALLAALVTGCTAGSGTEGSATVDKPGQATTSAAPPGKYRNLPEPCGSIELSTLKDLLPGAAELPEEQQQKVYRGTADVTYDTDRRGGCSWKAVAPDASHQLRVDFERVVSYDTVVSDDDRAQEVFTKKQAASSLPAATVPPGGGGKQSPPPSSPTATGTGAGTGAGTGTGPGTAPTAKPPATEDTEDTGGTATETPDGLEPRVLDDLGDAAFLDDILRRSGSTAQQRTVSVVFRTSNVVVTIEYGEQPARITEVPDSKELQDKAQSLARKLAEQIDD